MRQDAKLINKWGGSDLIDDLSKEWVHIPFVHIASRHNVQMSSQQVRVTYRGSRHQRRIVYLIDSLLNRIK
jgi:hypothetical protein